MTEADIDAAFAVNVKVPFVLVAELARPWPRKAWAAEFGPSGVRVNAVNPGPTRTEGTAVDGGRTAA